MINVEIITPTGVLHTAECDEVVIPTTSGYIGIRSGHLPLVTVLKKGEVRIKTKSKEEKFSVSDGFAEILPEKVSIVSRHSQQD